MIEFLKDWYHRYFSHPQATLMVVFLIIASVTIAYFGDMLAPVLAAIVIAYLLEGPVSQLEKRSVNRLIAVTVVFVIFITLLVLIVGGLFPIISRQLTNFFQELPSMINIGRDLLVKLPEQYPGIISATQIDEVTGQIRAGLSDFGQTVLSFSLATIPAMVTFLVYLILGPVLVFFFMKDKQSIIGWFTRLMPNDRAILTQVWHEMDVQIGNYVRGKVYEIFIVGGVTYATLAFLGLSYAPLLGVLVGLSVIVPYIGAAVVTLPVALAAFLQLGWGADFAWVMVAYFVIQALDGNLLVPLLFSDVVNLHPVAIIVAVLVFGGLWGFWGVFFAIPLATLVSSLLDAWPRSSELETASGQIETSASAP